MLKKGYTDAYFKWLSWIVITSFFLVFSVKVHSVFLSILAVLTGVLLFFTALSACLNEVENNSDIFATKFSKNTLIVLFVIFIFSVPVSVLFLLMIALKGVLVT